MAPPPPISTLYLLAYNSFQAIGWTVSLTIILHNLLSTSSLTGTYASAGTLISFLQCAAFLEVIHGAIGLVPSGVLLPLLQWGGRTHFLLAIVRQIHETGIEAGQRIKRWSVSSKDELPRGQLMTRVIPFIPEFLGSPISGIFLSYILTITTMYTAFIVLYPIGVFPGEMWLMYQALPIIKKKNIYADSFSSLPFSYYDFVKVVLVVYPFLWFKLYLHLFKQRHSKLYKRRDKKRA
ncbi:Protein-tyrosine phosphatase, PTPLA [Trifolium repens]|nr:Protein-tyrosine phosphatase, PTPLA [Trifolium repens]